MRTLLAALVLLSGASPALSAGCGGRADGAAVAEFVTALLARDGGALAAVLPRGGTLRLTTTIDRPWLSDAIPADRVAADLARGTGVHALLLDGGPDDDLADWIEGVGTGAWVEVEGGRFQPDKGDGRTFLRLGCEGGRPVVVEVGWPAS